MSRLLLAALFLLVCSPAVAAECKTLEAAITELKPVADKLHGEIIELTPAESGPYLDVVNAFPPATHMTADSVLLLTVPERGAAIILVSKGCAAFAGRIAVSLHDKALRAARGEGA